MIKVSIRLDKRYRLKNGKFPVRIKIARKENVLYLPTGYELEENEWDAESQKVIKRAGCISFDSYIKPQPWMHI